MNDLQYFQYGVKELEHLKSQDPNLAVVIDELGLIERAVIPDIFMALLNAIIGQQISTKAQATIWERMQTQLASLTPENINVVSAEVLQNCGISMRKALYIKEIAAAAQEGRLDFTQVQTLTDAEVCAKLSQLRGVGIWTAEMLLIFSMQRVDVMSWDDLAIQRGLRMLYRHRKITSRLFAKYKRRYKPYATVASIYLWAIAGGACASLTDCGAPQKKRHKKAACE